MPERVPRPDGSERARSDPDGRARTHLANERTFLAWLRTGISLVALGLGAAQFLDRGPVFGLPLTTSLAVFLIVGGAALVGLGAAHYRQSRDRIETETFRPAGRSVAAAAGLVVIGGLLALGLLFLLGRR